MKSMSPAAKSACTCFLTAAGWEPVSRPTRTPLPASSLVRERACCSASSSVGAIMAACQLPRTAVKATPAATAVLPLPTSP